MNTTHTEGWTLHWAHLYDLGTAVLGRRVRQLHQSVLEVAAIASGERVLDVGCGPGRLTTAAARAAGPTGETLGIDASTEMVDLAVKKARRAGSPATFRVAAIEALPYPDSHFDVVLANLMLHHLPEDLQRRGLAEVLRVLKPNGRFVAGDFSAMPGHGVGHILSVLGLRRGSEHAEHLRSVAAAAGFEAIRIEPATSRAFCVIYARKPASAH
jgi:demethylmenaquinone methyltransferase/2-methoxy-6-polyprenyl-1,4-benzoquinol methylase/phosphoethanolamine N-methyltransferase